MSIEQIAVPPHSGYEKEAAMTHGASRLTLVICLMAAWLGVVLPAHAQSTDTITLLAYWMLNSSAPPTPAQTPYSWSIAANANVDECFHVPIDDPAAIVASNASFFTAYPNDFSTQAVTDCINGYPDTLPKINQAYVWGLTANGSEIWFSTVANTLCLVLDSFYGATPSPVQTNDYVCNYQNNPYEDLKPPRMYVYNAQTKTLTDLTPSVYGDPNLLTSAGYPYFASNFVFGLRSAGTEGSVVFFGGLNLTGNVVMFAFNASTHAYLGSRVFDGVGGDMGPYTNIRQWHVYNGQLYTGVATPTGGQILRWTGSVGNPWSFDIVGNIGADPAYFTLHTDNRVYISTWPVNLTSLSTMSIYMSPPLHGSPAQLTTSDAASWTKVWDLSEYEVEPAAVQGGGAIASYGGYLYFGTMDVPGTGVVAFNAIYGPPTDEVAAFLGTYRPIAIFRSKGFATKKPRVELLYGNALLPKFNPETNSWNLVPNNLRGAGKYGRAGFGNFFNNYTWAADVYNNQLFFGTMDFSYLAGGMLGVPSIIETLTGESYGADLWSFASSKRAAQRIDGGGMGNPTSYGIRNMVVNSDGLWLGMANPMNLRSNPADNPGGWKLIELK